VIVGGNTGAPRTGQDEEGRTEGVVKRDLGKMEKENNVDHDGDDGSV